MTRRHVVTFVGKFSLCRDSKTFSLVVQPVTHSLQGESLTKGLSQKLVLRLLQ